MYFAYSFNYQELLGPKLQSHLRAVVYFKWYSAWHDRLPDAFLQLAVSGLSRCRWSGPDCTEQSMMKANSSRRMNIFMVLQDGLTSRILKTAGLLGNDEGFTLAHGKTKRPAAEYLRHNGPEHVHHMHLPVRVKVSALVVPTLLTGSIQR